MALAISHLSPRARSWHLAMAATPGDLDHHVPADQVVGEVPAGLRGGRFLSNGPGWTAFDSRLAHPFDGHGYVRSYRFNDDGSVDLKARFVRTEVFVDEEEAGTFVHKGLATNPTDRFWKNRNTGTVRNVANTTIYPWNSKLLAGWEAGEPHALDGATLETLGPHTFGGLVKGKVTLAHMGRDEARGRLVLCETTMGRKTGLTFREISADERLLQTRTGEAPGLAFVHDFAFTDRWYVIGGNPLRLKTWEVMKTLVGASTMLRSIKTNQNAPGELLLIPRDDQGPTRRIRLPEPSFVVHFANVFERDGDVIVDACVFHDFTFGEEFGYSGPHAPFDPQLPDLRSTQSLYRITVPDGATEATWVKLAPHSIDFPRVHPGYEGREAPFVVGATRADTRHSYPFDSIIRVDLNEPTEPTLWTADEHVFVGEPVIAPGREGTTDHVIAVLSDGLSETTTLAVFAADALDAGPVAQVPMPLMPIAFHGDWQKPT
jgi:carotenoid cleavage dioxygenase-like enzyme